MSDDKRRDDRIASLDGGPLTEDEIKQLRYMRSQFLYGDVKLEFIADDQKKVGLLWWALGWVPTTARNWKAIMVAIILAVFLGGERFLENVQKWLEGFAP